MLNDTMADRERDDNNGGGYIKELKLVSTQSTYSNYGGQKIQGH